MTLLGRVRRTPLFVAVSLAVVLGVSLAFGAYAVIGKLVGVKPDEPAAPLEIGRTALTLVAGVGGAVALVVAYRRQRDVEQGRFIERFGAAATQLGDPDVAVRIAGVYAMATTADEASSLARRQQCIDVLCGYLRLGFDPDQGTSNRTELVRRVRRGRVAPDIEGSEEESRFRFRQNDRVVRETIVRVIASHLKPSADVSWSENEFDFTGAYFSVAPFSGARFGSRKVAFSAATFGEGVTTFEGAHFKGDASFEGARFMCTDTTFEDVRFDSSASFSKAVFNGGGYTPVFHRAVFNANADFGKVDFLGAVPMFEHAKFHGGYTSFYGAQFSVQATFNGSQFSGGIASFNKAQFASGCEFNGVDFTNRGITFENTCFAGPHTSFYQSNFSSGVVSFENARFLSKNTNFSEPSAWQNVYVDWGRGRTPMPECVTPREWPPSVALPYELMIRRDSIQMRIKRIFVRWRGDGGS